MIFSQFLAAVTFFAYFFVWQTKKYVESEAKPQNITIPQKKKKIIILRNFSKTPQSLYMKTFKTGPLDPVSDKSLMFKVKAGDIDKLGLLYERYNKILFSYFWRLTASIETSEDLVQTVFYRILKNRKQFKGKGKFTSWMYRIAHNLWADFYKKNIRQENREDLEHWDLKDDLTIDEQIVREEQIRQLKSALNQLDPDKREVLVLSRYQGLKYHEIADLLKTTEGAVKTKAFRALNELKEIYVKMEN